jgi:hypothetical protein
MSNEQQNPGSNFSKVLLAELPVYGARRIYVPAGDVTVVNDKGVSVTVVEAEIDAVQNQGTFYNEITSITGTHLYVSY